MLVGYFVKCPLVSVFLRFFTLLDWPWEFWGRNHRGEVSLSCRVREHSDVSTVSPGEVHLADLVFFICGFIHVLSGSGSLEVAVPSGQGPCSACCVPLPSVSTHAVDLPVHVKTYLGLLFL